MHHEAQKCTELHTSDQIIANNIQITIIHQEHFNIAAAEKDMEYNVSHKHKHGYKCDRSQLKYN